MLNQKNHAISPFLFFMLSLICQTCLASEAVIVPDVDLKSKNVKTKKDNITLANTHYDKKQIEKAPVVNLTEFFKQQQSVVRPVNNSGDPNQTALSIRGFGDNAVANSLILVDGFLLINPSLLAPNFNSVPLSDIERIDIFQGSEGTLWGNQAVGGVVNIITKHPKKLFANAIVSIGSYSSNYYNLLAGDKFANNIYLKAFGLAGQTQNYRQHNRQLDNNLSAQIGKDYQSGTIALNVQTYATTSYFPGGLTEAQFKHNPQQATDFAGYIHLRTNLYQALNKQVLNDQWLLETRLSQQTTDGDSQRFVPLNRNDSLIMLSPRLIGHIKRNQITLGYDGQLSDYHFYTERANSKTSATQNDIYFQIVFPMTNKINLTLGSRAAWQNNQIETIIGQPVHSKNKVFVTEQGISYHATKQLSFYLRRDGNFSFPKANEENWVPANVKALQVQTGTSYETGVTWRTEKQKTQLNFYRLALNNEIDFDPKETPMNPFGSFANLDQTVRDGITLTNEYHLWDRTTLNGQLNYVNARFISGAYNGNTIPMVPTLNGNIGILHSWTEHWQTQYALLYTGSRFASDDLTNTGRRLSSYWLNDIALQYLFKWVIASFEIRNIFDKQYPAYAYFDSFTNENTYFPAPGRNYLLTLKVNMD